VKFQPDHLDGVNTIARHDRASVWVASRQHTGSVLVPWIGEVRTWAPRAFDELTPAHFDRILELQPELVIFGSGERIRFVAAPMIRGLIERRIGFEAMDTAAACRTFNVLVSEGRSVVAALLIDPSPG
jgi:uncharacterized protein